MVLHINKSTINTTTIIAKLSLHTIKDKSPVNIVPTDLLTQKVYKIQSYINWYKHLSPLRSFVRFLRTMQDSKYLKKAIKSLLLDFSSCLKTLLLSPRVDNSIQIYLDGNLILKDTNVCSS